MKGQTCCNQVIDDNDGLSRLYRIRLHLERVLKIRGRSFASRIGEIATDSAVLFLVRSRDALARKLALFAHRNESSAEPQRNNRPKEKTASIEANDDVDLSIGRRDDGVRCKVMEEVRYECLESNRVSEDREDIQKHDTLCTRL